jgi:hypothetical protein
MAGSYLPTCRKTAGDLLALARRPCVTTVQI